MSEKLREKRILDKFVEKLRDTKDKISVFSKKSKKNYFLLYFLAFTVVFSAIAFIFFFCMFNLYGRTLVWSLDGQDQYLVSLIYFGDWGKSIFEGLFSTGHLQIPFWDSAIAMGADVVITLNYYIVGDPLGLLAIFWPKEGYASLYTFIIVFRIFLAGVSFSVMCFYFKKGRFTVLLGALMYSFSGYILHYSTRHPLFIIPLYLLPLLIVGTEMIFKKKSPALFSIIIALSAVTNFYFFYYLTLMILMYSVARYMFHYRKVIEEKLIFLFLRFTKFYLIGVGLAAFLFLPTIFSFLGNGRVGANGYLPLFFHISEYLYYIPEVIVGYKFSPILFPCLVLLFMQKDPRYKILKFAVILFQAMLLIPVFGYIFNGFNYTIDRWQFLVSLVYSFICVCMIPKLKGITKKQIAILFVAFLVGISMLIVFSVATKERYFWFAVQGILLFFFIFISIYRSKANIRFLKVFVAVVVIFGIVVQGYFWYSPLEKDNTRNFMDKETMVFYDQEEPFEAEKTEKEPFYRTDITTRDTFNDSMIHGFNSTAGYFSTLSSVYFDFFNQTGAVPYLFTPSRFNGFDRRASLGALASVKYYERRSGSPLKDPPYGYRKVEKIEKNGFEYTIYKNKNFLPLGYTYSDVIYKQDFENLTPEQKQEAMVRTIYLEEPIEGYNSIPFKENYTIDFSVENNKNVSLTGNILEVKKANAGLKLTFNSLPNCETYIRLEQLVDRLKAPLQDREYYLSEESTESEKKLFEINNQYSRAPDIVDITVKSERTEGVRLLRNERTDFYSGVHDFTFNLGYNKEIVSEATLYFNKKGKYNLEDLNVISIPMEGFEERIGKLKEDVLKDVKFNTNMISGNISLKEDKILCLSIPYMKGFTAYVNGKETELLKANLMYSAIPLKAGKNEIVLRYKTPYLRAGVTVSLITAGLAVALYLLGKYRRKKGKVNG